MKSSSPISSRRRVLLNAALIFTVIALADWKVDADVPLGFLYLLPVLMAAGVLGRGAVLVLAVVATALSEAFDSFRWSPSSGIPRDVLYFAAFAGIGLFVHEIASRRRIAAAHLEQIEAEIAARRGIEEQLEHLVESSPIAIITADGEGRILMANEASHRLFEALPGGLLGVSISRYLPSLATVPALAGTRQLFRTVMQCRGHRGDGTIFLADVWFSTYPTSLGPRLAAMVIDASEDLRDREEAGLHQLLTGSRILVGAISHEVRNICGAIAVVHQNLARCEHLIENRDFEALGTLVLALEKLASMELRQAASTAISFDLQSFLEELRIIIEPSMLDAGIAVKWSIPRGPNPVWADRQSLMQVFLNLARNSQRALAGRPAPEVRVAVQIRPGGAHVTFADNGGGVACPELLFRPFQPNSQASGLGLYLSRALMRSFGGDLQYVPGNAGAAFAVELAISSAEQGSHEHEDHAPTAR